MYVIVMCTVSLSYLKITIVLLFQGNLVNTIFFLGKIR